MIDPTPALTASANGLQALSLAKLPYRHNFESLDSPKVDFMHSLVVNLCRDRAPVVLLLIHDVVLGAGHHPRALDPRNRLKSQLLGLSITRHTAI